MSLFSLLLPELILTAAALVLFMFGVFKSSASRAFVPWIALLGLVGAGVAAALGGLGLDAADVDFTRSVVAGAFGNYVKVLAAGVGVILLLLCWPTHRDHSGNNSLWWGLDAGEFFGLFLLSFVGIMLVGGANDTMLLFMGIELASIPTYVLVAMSRPLPEAQEAGVKYFYLGAMAAAVLLLGFAYLYGAVGTTNLSTTAAAFAEGRVNPALGAGTWQTLGVVLIVLGFCFKLAAVPLHFYAGDVYTGAATPVTAMLSFVPKATGILATVKLLLAVGGANAFMPGGGLTFDPTLWKVLFAISVLTMTVGNAMALLAENIKRVMAYSSIAHSGYMLAALTVLAAAAPLTGGRDAGEIGAAAVAGVLFYLAAYGVMNAGVFAVLMMLPSRRRFTDADGKEHRLPATTAETYADIRGAGRRHPWLTAAMAVCCISLIGIPLTVGFLGKLYVLRPALLLAGAAEAAQTPMYWLVGITLVNAAVAAAYYLRILSEMVLLKSPEEEDAEFEREVYTPAPAPGQPLPLIAATTLSVVGIFVFGLIPAGVSVLGDTAATAAESSRTMPAEMARTPTPAAPVAVLAD